MDSGFLVQCYMSAGCERSPSNMLYLFMVECYCAVEVFEQLLSFLNKHAHLQFVPFKYKGNDVFVHNIYVVYCVAEFS